MRVAEGHLRLSRTCCDKDGRHRTLLPPQRRGTEAEGRVSGPPSASLGPKQSAGPETISRTSPPSSNWSPTAFQLLAASDVPHQDRLDPTGCSLPHPSLAPPRHQPLVPNFRLRGVPPWCPWRPQPTVGKQCQSPGVPWPGSHSLSAPSHSAVTVISDTSPTHEGHRAAPGVQTQAFLSEEERILALPES